VYNKAFGSCGCGHQSKYRYRSNELIRLTATPSTTGVQYGARTSCLAFQLVVGNSKMHDWDAAVEFIVRPLPLTLVISCVVAFVAGTRVSSEFEGASVGVGFEPTTSPSKELEKMKQQTASYGVEAAVVAGRETKGTKTAGRAGLPRRLQPRHKTAAAHHNQKKNRMLKSRRRRLHQIGQYRRHERLPASNGKKRRRINELSDEAKELIEILRPKVETATATTGADSNDSQFRHGTRPGHGKNETIRHLLARALTSSTHKLLARSPPPAQM
jgi:hypothetical protein